MASAISVSGLRKSFQVQELYENLTFEVETGKITALFGPNGCGKSTLLNILAGLISKDAGTIQIEDFHPFRFSYVFQSYRESLLPWRTNFDNLAFPLEIQKWDRQRINTRIKELQAFFELKFSLNSYPFELSGGQQQMLAFLRALAPKPQLLFLDEPFSALDYENNIRLREKLEAYYLQEKPTVLLISHNIEEAVQVAHKILILSRTPTTILEQVENTLPYPRTLETLKSREFEQTKDRILSIFQRTVQL